jgi:hypothetical protein
MLTSDLFYDLPSDHFPVDFYTNIVSVLITYSAYFSPIDFIKLDNNAT